jgi:SAM-dependent methyltransferase
MKPAVAGFYWEHIAGARRVLDIGCGAGDLGMYGPATSEVWGIEINRALVEQAKRFESVEVWDLDSPDPLPFGDVFFDAVVAKDVLEHLTRPWQVLREVRRVLKPGGIVLASVICHRGRRVWDDYTHVRGFTMRSARQMFGDAGFNVLDVWRMGGVPLSSRLKAIWLVPYVLRFPVFDWLWTSSYEIKARRPP